jgi:ankyrin repeat protein
MAPHKFFRLTLLCMAAGITLANATNAMNTNSALEPVRSQLRLKQFDKAAGLLKPMADNGNADAERLLANLYLNGLGVPEDHKLAAQWLERAAGQGNTDAMYELASLLADGDAPDHAVIQQWLQRAAQAGHSLAKQAVQQQLDPMRFQPDNALQDASTRRAAFWLAAMHNNVPQLQAFNDPGLVNATDEFGRTALAYAVRHGATQATEWLLQSGATSNQATKQAGKDSANHADSFGVTPLMLAASHGQLATMNLLIKAGANINAQDNVGNTALMYAIGKQQQNCIEMLLTSSNLQLRNAQNWSALDWAIHNNDTALAARLRSMGLESTRKAVAASSTPAIPLQHASNNDLYRNWPDVLIASTRNGTDLFDAVAQSSDNALRGNEAAALLTAVQAGNTKLIDKLLIRGLKPSADANETALSWAVRHNKPDITQQLLNKGIAPDLHGKTETTPLFDAVRLDTPSALPLVDALLKSGAKTDSRDSLGRTALIASAQLQHAALVQRLLQSGANDELVDNTGHTALMYAAMSGSEETVHLLTARNASLDRRDNDGNSALMLAAAAGNTGAVAQLIAAGASTQGNKAGVTALMLAASSGQEAIVKKLLAAGLKPDAQNKHGDTALMFAARAGQVSTLQALLAAGADAKLRNNDRASAKDIAERLAFKEAVTALAQRS